MIKARQDNTNIRVGWCPYCGKEKTFIVQKNTPQTTLNSRAFMECDCEDARINREEREIAAAYFSARGRFDLVGKVRGN